MWTDYVNGERQRDEIVSMLAGASQGIPFEVSYFNIELNDEISWGKPNMYNLEGPSALLSF